MTVCFVDFAVTQMFGTVADFSLLIGVLFKVQKCVRFYLAIMLGVMIFEVLESGVFFLLGYDLVFAQVSIFCGGK